MNKTNFTDRDSGALFPNKNKAGPNHPDFRGSITLTPETIEFLQNGLDGDDVGKLEIAAWKKTSLKGAQFLSVSLSRPFKKDEGFGNMSGTPRKTTQKDPNDPLPWE